MGGWHVGGVNGAAAPTTPGEYGSRPRKRYCRDEEQAVQRPSEPTPSHPHCEPARDCLVHGNDMLHGRSDRRAGAIVGQPPAASLHARILHAARAGQRWATGSERVRNGGRTRRTLPDMERLQVLELESVLRWRPRPRASHGFAPGPEVRKLRFVPIF